MPHYPSMLRTARLTLRRALEQVPEGKYDWKPHEKLMIFGYLSDMVATMPGSLLAITRDELLVWPIGGRRSIPVDLMAFMRFHLLA